MAYQLRQPIFEILNDHEIKLVSGGRKSLTIVITLLAFLTAGVFGFAVFVKSGLGIGLIFALAIGGSMLKIAQVSFKTAKYFIFNVQTGLVTRCSIMGGETNSWVDTSLQISSYRQRHRRFSILELYMNLDGKKTLVARYTYSELSKATTDFFSLLLKESLKSGDVKKTFASLNGDVRKFELIFKNDHNITLSRTIISSLGNIFLYVFAAVMILVVAAMVFAFIYSVVSG